MYGVGSELSHKGDVGVVLTLGESITYRGLVVVQRDTMDAYATAIYSEFRLGIHLNLAEARSDLDHIVAHGDPHLVEARLCR